MRKILFTSVLMFLAIWMTAQSYKGSGGAFSLGVQSMETGNLPSITESAPDLSGIGLNFGGYVYWQWNRFTVGIKGYGLYGFRQTEGDFSHQLTGGAALAEFGYKILYQEKNAIFPFVGVGYGGVNYLVEDTRDKILISEPRPVLTSGDYRWQGMVFDAGLRWERFVKFDDDEPEAGLWGLEAGYQFSPGNRNWRTGGGGEITDAIPDYAFGGWFVKLTLGGFEGFFE